MPLTRKPRTTRRQSWRPRLEELEARRVLSCDVIVNELMADNDDALLDYYDDSSDWFELLNVGVSNVDLAGWHLTDDPTDLAQWEFPVSQMLAPQQRLVVFASGRDLVAANGEFHTNFQLASNGEYLAVVEPDGTTICWEAAPQYPPQEEDISFGRFTGDVTTTLLDGTQATDVLVPHSAGELAANWNDPAFQPTTWQSATASIGYDRPLPMEPDTLPGLRLWLKADDITDGAEPANGTIITTWQDHSGNDHDAIVATDISATFTGPTHQEVTLSTPTGNNTFPVARFTMGADELLRATDIINGPDNNNEAAESANFGELTIITVYFADFISQANQPMGFGTSASSNRGGVNANNFRLGNNPSIQKDNGEIDGHSLVIPTDFFIRTTVMSAAGDGLVEEYFDGTLALSKTENFSVRSDNFYLGDTRFPFVSTGDIAELIVYDRALDEGQRQTVEGYLSEKYFHATVTGNDGPYAEIFTTNLAGLMQGKNPSAFLRTEFDVVDPATVDRLTLSVQYDDGFVAYLNGTEVAGRNAPATLAWNSLATVNRLDALAVVPEPIDISTHAGLLTTTDNLLAIHGLNVAADSSDFLIVVELTATDEDSLESQFFDQPTPGTPNTTPAFPAVMQPPVISVPGGTFTSSFAVELTTDQPGAEIRYTTNRSVPTSTSPLYTGPITISTRTQLRARVFAPNSIPSKTVSETYLKIAVDLVGFSSDIPLIILDSFGATVSKGGFSSGSITVFEPNGDGRASIDDTATISSRGGLQLRGKSTIANPKRNFSIEFWQEDADEDRDLALLGMPADSDWVLRGPFDIDRSFTRDAFAFELSNQVGRYAPRTRFVEVFDNQSGSDVSFASDYAGVYVLSERIKRGANRVDVEKLSASFTTEPEITGGYIIKRDDANPGDGGFTVGGLGLQWHEPSESEIHQRSAQRTYLTNYLSEFYAALSNVPNFTHPTSGQHYSEYIDFQSWIDHNILSVYMLEGDAFWLSTYMFKNRDGKLEMGPLWDMDRSMDSGIEPGDNSPFAWQNTIRTGPYLDFAWWQHLWDDPDFHQGWIDRWQQWRDGPLSNSNVTEIMDRFAAELMEAQVRNCDRWCGTPSALGGVNQVVDPRTFGGQFVTGTWQGSGALDGTWQGEINHHKVWLETRADWMDTQFLSRPTLSHQGGIIQQPFSLTLSGPAGATLYYTTDGTDPRASGGGISGSATAYSGPINVSDDTVIRVRTYNASFTSQFHGIERWSGPQFASFTLDESPVRITEINYNPHAPTVSELATIPSLDNDDFEFVEVQNTGAGSVDVTNYAFTNGITFTFPTAQLAAGGRALIVKDQAAFELRYGTGLNLLGEFESGGLNNGGENLQLLNASANMILDFSYDDRDPWPERADGSGGTLELVDPANTPTEQFNKYYHWRGSTELGGSPGTAGADPAGVVINEVLAHTDPPVTESDSIELYNPTASQIDIGGWYLSDSDNNFSKFQIPPGTMLPAGGYLLLDENDFNPTPLSPGPNDFALSGAHGDDVWLVDPDGGGPGVLWFVDDVHFGSSANGESFARLLDGSGRLLPAVGRTLNASNSQGRVGPLVISEINYNPGTPSPAALAIHPSLPSEDLEFVEIYNPTGAAVDLTAWRIRGGIDYDFDPGTMLGAGETLVVISFNPDGATNTTRVTAFRAHYGIDANVPLVGGYQNRLSNGSERVQLQRPDTPPPEEPLFIPHLHEDEALYDDLVPWPTVADGTGVSLHRTDTGGLGSDAASWTAGTPGPGQADRPGDTDLDGDVDTSDLTTAIINFTGAGGIGKTWTEGDTDGDGDVDTVDLTTAIINFTGATAEARLSSNNIDMTADSRTRNSSIAPGESQSAASRWRPAFPLSARRDALGELSQLKVWPWTPWELTFAELAASRSY